MREKAAIRKVIPILFVLFVFVITATERIFPWGAMVNVAATHQKILSEAYKLLMADPVFRGSGFPKNTSIEAYEGITPIGEMLAWDAMGYGGPDKSGATPYSFHYYNPVTRKGNAPQATKLFYQNLLNPNASAYDRAKGAAWSAHFLADMCVPYHVVGMPREDALEAYNNEIATLSPDIFGTEHLYSGNSMGVPRPPVGWGRNGILLYATRNFIEKHSHDEMADWYDPWYTNGLSYVAEVVSGSHASWEFKVDQLVVFNSGYTATHLPQHLRAVSRYHPQWRNPVSDPTFLNSSPASSRQNMLREIQPFVKRIAQITRQNMESICDNYKLGIDQAIQSVASLWRSTLTGLRPRISAGMNLERPGYYQVECTVENGTVDSARNVTGRLTVFHPGGEDRYFQSLKYELQPNHQGTLYYQIPVEPESSYGLYFEVTAAYTIPDLQYAFVQTNFKTTQFVTPHAQMEDPLNPWIGGWEFESLTVKDRKVMGTGQLSVKYENNRYMVYDIEQGTSIEAQIRGNSLICTFSHSEGDAVVDLTLQEGGYSFTGKTTLGGRIQSYIRGRKLF